jgi:hypothetical protein
MSTLIITITILFYLLAGVALGKYFDVTKRGKFVRGVFVLTWIMVLIIVIILIPFFYIVKGDSENW